MKEKMLRIAANLLSFIFIGAVLIGSVSAKGWISDMIVKPFDPDLVKQLDKAHDALGKPLDSTMASINAAEMKSLMDDINKKSDLELISLSFSLSPCFEIACRNIPPNVVKQLISATIERNRAVTDLEVRRYQAWAAIGSASIALLSLIISIISLIRSSKSSKKLLDTNLVQHVQAKSSV